MLSKAFSICFVIALVASIVATTLCLTRALKSAGAASRANGEVFGQFTGELPKNEDKPYKLINAYVTAYNTVVAQTDSTPCIGAAGTNVCGRKDVAACPHAHPLGTTIEIMGNFYMCMDRTASKYRDRFDLSFDKDVQGAKEFGKRYLEIKIYEN